MNRPAVRGVLAQLGLVALGVIAYVGVRTLTLDRTTEAVDHAREVLALEEALGLDVELALQQAVHDAVPWLERLATWFYVWGYFPALVTATAWLYVRHRPHYVRLRTGLLASGAVGLLVYALYPCAPPWMTDPRIVDTVSAASLDAFARPAAVMNEVGAMPSFHVGWLTLAAAVVWSATRSWTVRAWCVLHPTAMALAVVLTGNHWVLDIPAGLALAGIGLLAPRWWPAARHRSVRAAAG